MAGQNLKALSELKFDSIGEEFIYLHNKISKQKPRIRRKKINKKKR